MGPTTRYAFVIVFALSYVITLPCAQSQTTTAKKALGGRVAGKVTIKGKGAPNIVVSLHSSEMNSPFDPSYKATTDQDGNYLIIDVPAGSYEVTTVAPAFVIADSKDARGQTVVLGEGERVENVNFSLVRGGVITGKVIDADGRPVIQQQVSLYRADVLEQQRGQIYPTRNVYTDDRGIYRMFGIVSGLYKVAVGRGDNAFFGSLAIGRASYKRVFHPDVSDQAKATIIEVSEGSEATNVDITLGRAMETFKASGRVVDDEKGFPMPNVTFGLQRIIGNHSEYMNSPVTSNSQGDFIIESLIPGKYSVFLMPEPNDEVRIEAPGFDVVDQDVEGLTIRLTKGASVAGVVLLESADKSAFAKLVQLNLQAYVPAQRSGMFMGQYANATIAPDGSFHLGGLPAGMAVFSLGETQLKGFRLTRVEREGIVQPGGVEIKEGEQVSGVRLVVSYGNATLRGVVVLENGPLPENDSILVRLVRPGETSFFIQAPSVDARGHFLIDGLQGGLYELSVSVLWSGGKPGPPVKQQVNVQDGSISDVSITIDISAKAGASSP
jgi:hypothetical protein